MRVSEARTHSLYRTSPKGEQFVGTCSLCGRTNLLLRDSQQYCENVRGLTEQEALLEAIGNPDE